MLADTSVIALKYVPIPKEIVDEARRALKDRFGHDLHVQMSAAPCRYCLQISTVAEKIILLSYQPLPDTSPYAEIGPIFIHATACEPYSSDAFPPDFLRRSLILRAYDHEGNIVDALVSQPGMAELDATTFLRNPTVAEIHVRHTTYTCYDFKIVRKAEM